MVEEKIRLTQYSHGAGCGCKIAPQMLEEILSGQLVLPDNKNLLVGNHSKDDAAVYDLGNGTAVISTTDFFMPIVDDPIQFGRIASANAISDVYAMGGRPLMAIAVLGWPVNKIAPSVAKQVIEGARITCLEASIPLAGGHSIDSPEPIFGLAVTGLVDTKKIKQNNTAKAGDYLFLTKPLGVGILTTAEKRGQLLPGHEGIAAAQMMMLNKLGEELGNWPSVHAMTDVTGFGLGGHLTEMAEGSRQSATLDWKTIPLSADLDFYVENKIFPGGSTRNWNSYGAGIHFDEGVPEFFAKTVLTDPQTNGGLLVSVAPDGVKDLQALLTSRGFEKQVQPIGRITERGEKLITVH